MASLESDIGMDGEDALVQLDCRRLASDVSHQLKDPPPSAYVLEWRGAMLETELDSQRCESDAASDINSGDPAPVGDVEIIRQDVGAVNDSLQSIEVGATGYSGP
jgi:hypothetical protein